MSHPHISPSFIAERKPLRCTASCIGMKHSAEDSQPNRRPLTAARPAIEVAATIVTKSPSGGRMQPAQAGFAPFAACGLYRRVTAKRNGSFCVERPQNLRAGTKITRLVAQRRSVGRGAASPSAPNEQHRSRRRMTGGAFGSAGTELPACRTRPGGRTRLGACGSTRWTGAEFSPRRETRVFIEHTRGR